MNKEVAISFFLRLAELKDNPKLQEEVFLANKTAFLTEVFPVVAKVISEKKGELL
jgi:hypothetical protein